MIDALPSEMIFGLAVAIEMEMSISDLRQIVFPHPSVSEAIREAVWKFNDGK
jgi:dihydrolipoamide dehydrogenase